IAPVPGKLLVKLRTQDPKEGERFAEKQQLRYDDRMSQHLLPFHQLLIPEEMRQPRNGSSHKIHPGEPSGAFELELKLSQMEEVEVVALDWLTFFALALVPSDTLWANQWNMTRIGMPTAWDQETGAAGVIIAVTDSGVDLTHPDLLLTPLAT